MQAFVHGPLTEPDDTPPPPEEFQYPSPADSQAAFAQLVEEPPDGLHSLMRRIDEQLCIYGGDFKEVHEQM